MTTPAPIYDTPILGMTTRPRVASAVEYGNAASFWVEYPSGLVDVTRTVHLKQGPLEDGDVAQSQAAEAAPIPPLKTETQLELPVDGDRVVRLVKERTALIVIDMQKYVQCKLQSPSI